LLLAAGACILSAEAMKAEDDGPNELGSEELNPFLTLGLCLDEDDADPASTFSGSNVRDSAVLRSLLSPSQPLAPTPKTRHRNWGIPSFEEQCNGRRTFDITINERTVVLNLEHRRCSTGSDLWDSALVLAHALARLSAIEGTNITLKSLQGKSVLELGSGTGAVGLVCAKCLMADMVILTDLEPNLVLVERNVRYNNVDRCIVSSLDWQDETAPSRALRESKSSRLLDLIVGSDLFLPFAKHLLQPLARTLRDLLVNPMCCAPHAIAFICYEERFNVSDFFVFASGYGLVASEVCRHLLHPYFQDPQIHLLRITT
jgi:hypothetical protein